MDVSQITALIGAATLIVFVAVVASVLVQGSTLPFLARRFGLTGEPS